MRVPLHKVLEALLVLQDCAQAAQADSLQSVITVLDQIEEDLNALNVEEVHLRTLVTIDSVLEVVKSGQDESCRVA